MHVHLIWNKLLKAIAAKNDLVRKNKSLLVKTMSSRHLISYFCNQPIIKIVFSSSHQFFSLVFLYIFPSSIVEIVIEDATSAKVMQGRYNFENSNFVPFWKILHLQWRTRWHIWWTRADYVYILTYLCKLEAFYFITIFLLFLLKKQSSQNCWKFKELRSISKSKSWKNGYFLGIAKNFIVICNFISLIKFYNVIKCLFEHFTS